MLGAELKALYWMHGVTGTFHGFLRLNDHSYVAFVQNPTIAATAGVPGVSHADNMGSHSAPGTMQHVAFNVDTDEALLAMRDRIRAHGVNVFGPLDHGMCKSIYFAGPEGLNLEVATSATVIDERAWIDPEVQALVGISTAELARFTGPADYVNTYGVAVEQPPIDPTKPHFIYPPDIYEALMFTPDDVMAKRSQSDPPVKVAE